MTNQQQKPGQNLEIFNFNPEILYIDDQVDVRQRLIYLRHWEAEQKAQDQQLKGRLMALEHELMAARDRRAIRLIEQKQNMIGILRKRNLVLTVKIPFAISPEAVESLGYENLFNHFAGQYASLTKDEKLLWLNNLYFLITPDVITLLDKLSLIIRRTAQGEQRNLLIGGDSGSGKTRFLEWISAINMPSVEDERN